MFELGPKVHWKLLMGLDGDILLIASIYVWRICWRWTKLKEAVVGMEERCGGHLKYREGSRDGEDGWISEIKEIPQEQSAEVLL